MYERFPWNICEGCCIQAGTWIRPSFGLAYDRIVETNFPKPASILISVRGGGKDWTQSFDKSPYTNTTEKSKQQHDNTKHPHNFDYITIADRLRAVS